MFIMIQKCTLIRVAEIFFKEPATIHFIKGISRRIKLAPTSVRNHLKELLKAGIIVNKKSRPFSGFMANRESEDFIFYKRLYNTYSLKELENALYETYYPQLILLFGSYSRGEDIESSDVDILAVTKTKKSFSLEKFEKKLGRRINLVIIDSIKRVDSNVLINMKNGIVLRGAWK